MRKHAYLIIAHKNDVTLQTLLSLLDDPRNDIYIHMDKKNINFKQNYEAKYSKIIYIDRISVMWGGYSQIEAEMKLFEAAVNSGVDYTFCHLVSGQDLPIKSMEEVYSFFEKNAGKIFLEFQSEYFCFYERVKYFYFFQDLFGKKKITSILNKISIDIQKVIGVDRSKNMDYQKGSNWGSFPLEFLSYLLKNKELIKKQFKYTLCADEIYKQTMLIHSPYVKDLYYKQFDNNPIAIKRYIDWDRGNPYVFRNGDFNNLIKSPYLFARKFDCTVDSDIINKIYKTFR
ncbi:beta-1,6-N-acetylglucosaminyltransferase [Aerococcus urinae]